MREVLCPRAHLSPSVPGRTKYIPIVGNEDLKIRGDVIKTEHSSCDGRLPQSAAADFMAVFSDCPPSMLSCPTTVRPRRSIQHNSTPDMSLLRRQAWKRRNSLDQNSSVGDLRRLCKVIAPGCEVSMDSLVSTDSSCDSMHTTPKPTRQHTNSTNEVEFQLLVQLLSTPSSGATKGLSRPNAEPIIEASGECPSAVHNEGIQQVSSENFRYMSFWSELIRDIQNTGPGRKRMLWVGPSNGSRSFVVRKKCYSGKALVDWLHAYVCTHPLFKERGDRIDRDKAAQLASKLLQDGVLMPFTSDVSNTTRRALLEQFKDAANAFYLVQESKSLQLAQSAFR